MNAMSFPLQDGRYQIKETDAGIYLSVWPPFNGGVPVQKAVIIQELKDRHHTSNFDSQFVSVVIRQAIGQPVLIVNSVAAQAGRYQIMATDAGIYLSVWPPVHGGAPVKKTAVIDELTTRGITNFESDYIAAVIKEAAGVPALVANSLMPENGYYQITATDAGVFLSVWPPVSSGLPVRKTDIIQDLTHRGITHYDSDFISAIIKEAIGRPTLVVAPQPEVQVEATVRVRVRPDHMEARVDIIAPAGAPKVTMARVKEKLKAAGVVFGIDEQVLEPLVQAGAGVGIVCASGILPQAGEDAFLKYHFDADSQGRPVQMEDGRVDFKDTNFYLCVEEGQPLVEKIPATAGVSGIDVFGLPVLPKPGKDIPLPVGKNVTVIDNSRLYAGINGHLHVFLDKRINVIPVIIIDGDVDYSTGNIDFRGSVIVRGSVQADFSVKAGGNVEVRGSICGGMVEGNNVIVRTGIQGMNRSIIKARERVVTNFIESAFVYADEAVIVKDVIMNSSVFAGIRIIVEGGRGLIRGGRLSAGEEIRAVTIGNQANVVTDLEVSINPFLKDELLALRLEWKQAEATCAEMKRTLSYLQSQGLTNLTADKKERYKKTKDSYIRSQDRIEEIQQRIQNIERLLYALKPGKIRVSGVLHPGTKVCIGPASRTFNDRHQYVCLYVEEADIVFTSIR